MLVVTVLDLNALGFERHVQYEDVGGDCLELERSWMRDTLSMKTLVVTVLDLNTLGLKRHDQYEDVGGDGLGL